MRLPFARRDYLLERLQRDDSAQIAGLHREDFARPWSPAEFTALIDQDTVFGFVAHEVGHRQQLAGFVLSRLAADEAEILTVAVARTHRRQGIGRDLMEAVMRELHGARASHLMLEVDETNLPAVALYRRLGFSQVGKRPGYYAGTQGKPATGALVMRRDLR